MAKNAWLGLELARDVREIDPLALLSHLNAHDTWPFGFSLLLVPYYLQFGESFTVAAIPSAVCFALLGPAIVALARQVERGAATLAGALLASVVLIGSPLTAAHGILILRETAGMLFLTAAAALYLSARRVDTLSAWRCAGVAAVWLFFIKFNYGLFLLVAAALDFAASRSSTQWRRLASAAGSALRRCRSPRTVEFWIVTSWLFLAGAFALDLSPGTVLFGVLVSWTAALAVRWRTLGRRALVRVRSLPPAPRATVETLIVPIWLWCLGPSPMHARGLVSFLLNRDSGLGAPGGARFYLEAFVDQLVPGRAVAAAAAVGVVLALILRPRSAPLRFLALLVATTVALPLLHPYKLERFLLTALPSLLLLAGLGWAWTAERLARAARLGRWSPLAAFALPFALFPAVDLPPMRFVGASYAASSAPATLRPALTALVELAPEQGRVAVVGTFNALSSEHVWWQLAQRHGRELEPVRSPPHLAASAADAAVDRHVERWLRRRRPEAVLAIVADPSNPLRRDEDFRRYSLWQDRIVESLARHPDWMELSRCHEDDAQLELMLFTRRQRASGEG